MVAHAYACVRALAVRASPHPPHPSKQHYSAAASMVLGTRRTIPLPRATAATGAPIQSTLTNNSAWLPVRVRRRLVPGVVCWSSTGRLRATLGVDGAAGTCSSPWRTASVLDWSATVAVNDSMGSDDGIGNAAWIVVAGLVPGLLVTGTGVPSSTTVSAVNTVSVQVTLTANATVSYTGVTLNFYPLGRPYTDTTHSSQYVCTPTGWVTSTSSGVTQINGTAGAFTFSGSGVSCTTTTCTFTGASSGIGRLIICGTNGTLPLEHSALSH